MGRLLGRCVEPAGRARDAPCCWRAAQFWGKSALNVLVHLPLVLPPVVTGYVLLLLFGRKGPLGRVLAEYLGIVFAFRWTGAALACAVMGFPLMVRAIRLSLDAVDRRLEDAAGTLGAGTVWVFLTITLPLILPGILAGMILSFARALRRIRRDDHLCVEHPRRDADPADRDLYADAGPRRRGRRVAPEPGRGRDLDGGIVRSRSESVERAARRALGR